MTTVKVVKKDALDKNNNLISAEDYHPTEKGHEIWSRYLYDKVI